MWLRRLATLLLYQLMSITMAGCFRTLWQICKASKSTYATSDKNPPVTKCHLLLTGSFMFCSFESYTLDLISKCCPFFLLLRQEEVKHIVERCMLIREVLGDRLRLLGTPGSWDHLTKQGGLYCHTGLNGEYVCIVIKYSSCFLPVQLKAVTLISVHWHSIRGNIYLQNSYCPLDYLKEPHVMRTTLITANQYLLFKDIVE